MRTQWLSSFCNQRKKIISSLNDDKEILNGAFDSYLPESLDLVLELHLPGPAAEVCKSRGRAAAPAGLLCLQLEELQMLQLAAQVLY